MWVDSIWGYICGSGQGGQPVAVVGVGVFCVEAVVLVFVVGIARKHFFVLPDDITQ